MRGYRDFIIKVDFVYNKTFKTESGLELHADSRFSQDRLSNRIAVVEEVPLNIENTTPIKKGYQVMIDPSIYYGINTIVTGQQLSPFVIDLHKGLYRISNEMVVLYRENENDDWKAYNESLLIKFKKVELEEKKVGLIIMETKKTSVSKDRATVKFSNELIKEDGINNGDSIIVQEGLGVPFWIDGIEYNWINNRHVLAKLN